MKRILTLMLALLSAWTAGAQRNSFRPGELWPDDHGVPVNAHGGGILLQGKTYYWFGEHKTEGRAGNQAHVGVHCYSSRDLYNWKDEGVRRTCVAVRKYQAALGYSEAWMTEYVHTVVMLAKKEKRPQTQE